MSGTVHLERDGDIAVLIIDNPPVNAGSSDVRKALLRRIAEVEADATLAGAVLIGAGKSFIAGSDLREFDLPLEPPQLPQVIEAIEGSSKAYVAALHGAALGGGYELALGCDARIAAPGTVVGLPECTLGIIPGAGGTQKLPRLVGKAKAISLICTGGRVSSPEALLLGMIDAVAETDLREEAVALARSLKSRKQRVIELPVPEDKPVDIEAATSKAVAAGRKPAAHSGGYPSCDGSRYGRCSRGPGRQSARSSSNCVSRPRRTPYGISSLPNVRQHVETCQRA
jgi:3-hydroxyacyl-CoA dehydrogenase